MSYLARVCGPVRGDRLLPTALAEIAERMSGAPGSDAIEVVGRVARRHAFGELAADAHSGRRRLSSLVRPRCAALPRLLHQRSGDEMPSRDFDRLDRHLARCQRCAAVAGRVDAAEWYLHLELAKRTNPPATSQSNGGPPTRAWRPADPVAPAQRSSNDPVAPPQRSSNGPTPPSQPHTNGPIERDALVGSATGARLPPADPRPPAQAEAEAEFHPTPPAPGRPRRRRSATVGVLGLVALIGLGALGITTLGKSTPRPPATRPSSPPVSPAPPVGGAAVPPAAAAVHHTPTQIRAPRKPFVAAGTRFLVVTGSKADGALFATRVSPRPRRRWELVSITATRLTSAGSDPRRLAYRLVDARGSVYLPNTALGTPAVPAPQQPLASGRSTRIELAFEVPSTGPRLQLRFNPKQALRVEVPLPR